MATSYDAESVRLFAQESIDGYNIRQYLEHITSYAHEAGTEGNYFVANWMVNTWKLVCELDNTALLSYNILANYPTAEGRSVKVLKPTDQQWSARLEENNVVASREQTLAFHAYSPNGVVQGPLIYAGAGGDEDFDFLHLNGIVTSGTIALLRQDASHGPQNTGFKIRAAERAGCIGALIFNGDSLANPRIATTWPNSALPGNDSLHRADTAYSNWGLGDPLSIGHASVKGARRDRKLADGVLPKIPSLPLSWHEASHLISTIAGHGIQAPSGWLVDSAYTGNGSVNRDGIAAPVLVQLQNENDIVESQPIWNGFGIIEGAESSTMKVVVGAPRDSWCFGASHSASASAILTEVVAIFGILRKQGWRPLRTIEFVTWDASTFNHAGSTEYVEDTADNLAGSTIAYINVAGVSGRDFRASGSPLLQRSLKHALDRVNVPGGNQSLGEAFFDGKKLEGIQEMSDSAPFTYIAGVPALNLQMTDEQGSWVQGSCYDTFDWVTKFSDASDELEYHKAMAAVWALVVLDLVSAPMLPLDTRVYANQVASSVTALEDELHKLISSLDTDESMESLGLDLQPLHSAADLLSQTAESFHKFEADWMNSVLSAGGMEDVYQNRLRTVWNAHLMQFERSFIDTQHNKRDGSQGGLPGRPQFKHVLSAPKKWIEGFQSFPSIWEYLDAGQWSEAAQEINRVAGMISTAGSSLNIT